MSVNAVTIQEYLNSKFSGAIPKLVTDGMIGAKTRRAADAYLLALARSGVLKSTGLDNWSDDRKLIAVEQDYYNSLGIEAGEVDGLIGEQTRYARRVYDDKKAGKNTELTWRDEAEKTAPDVSPKASPSLAKSWPTQAAVPSFFGPVGANLVRFDFPISMRIAWNIEQRVMHTSCNRKCLDAFKGIFENAVKEYGETQFRAIRLDMFGGLFNPRKMRGSANSWSMHAYGIAIDIDPDRNQLKWKRNQASLDNPEYDKWWNIVESYGGVSLGRMRNYDWMHFQFARLG